jgi:ubiquitin related modifier 1
MSISLRIQFSGGLEYLFDHEPSHPLKMNLTIPESVPIDNSSHVIQLSPGAKTKPADISYLIHYIRDHHLKERAELFVDNGTV